jgi:hypothetical protein
VLRSSPRFGEVHVPPRTTSTVRQDGQEPGGCRLPAGLRDQILPGHFPRSLVLSRSSPSMVTRPRQYLESNAVNYFHSLRRPFAGSVESAAVSEPCLEILAGQLADSFPGSGLICDCRSFTLGACNLPRFVVVTPLPLERPIHKIKSYDLA